MTLFGERLSSNRVKSVIDLCTGEVPAVSANGNDIILDSDLLLDSDGKIRMQYVVSDPDTDVGDGTRGSMGFTLTASYKGGGIGFPDESGGMVGAQVVLGIPQYYMIVKYDLKVYTDQATLTYEQQTLIDASVEVVYGDIFLKFKNFLLEEGENGIIINGTHK